MAVSDALGILKDYIGLAMLHNGHRVNCQRCTNTISMGNDNVMYKISHMVKVESGETKLEVLTLQTCETCLKEIAAFMNEKVERNEIHTEGSKT